MQDRIIQLLRENKKPMTPTEVSQSLHSDRNGITRKLNKLVKFKMLTKTRFVDERRHFGVKFRSIR